LDKKELILDDDTLKTFNQFSVSASFSDFFLFSKSGTGNPVEEHGDMMECIAISKGTHFPR